jgi:predicted urease superfamily metal-dependent hydrolase
MRSNRRKKRTTTTSSRRFITIGGIAVIGVIVAFMVFLQIDAARNNEFKRAYEKIVIDTNALTKEYTREEAKWLAQDNSTLIKVIDQYQPRYEQLVEMAKALDTPEKYTQSRNYLVSAIDLEKQSYQHFRNYLATGNHTEYEKSSEMLSKSLAESANADAAIQAAG